LPFVYPPLEEQRRIAEVLDRAEALRAKRRAALAQLDTLTQSIFLALFGDPDENPKAWPIQQVSDYVAEFQGGKSLEAEGGENVAARNRVLKISAVTSTEFEPDENKPVPDSYEPPSDHFVRPGDLLFSRANTTELVGAVAYVERTPPNLLLPDKLWRFVWRLYAANDLTHATHEPLAKSVSVSLVPFRRRLELRASGRRENRWLHFERKRPRVSDLTCSQGIVFAVPASSSLTLRSSSTAHAAAHLGSSGPSTLSRISVASASRSSAGSCSARCRSSDGLACAMGQF
jgi:hypothetical protein